MARRARGRTRAGGGGEIVPLNLAMTYPVRWSRFKVLRDFVQNFFDAVGPEAFARRVTWARDGEALELRAEGVAFSHEWLVAIGASTKTSAKKGRYAGHFGEGFKVAALCAVRDHGWTVAAGSRDWALDVTSRAQRIDGRNVEMLAYRLVRQRGCDSGSWVRLGRASVSDGVLLAEAVVPSFYFPENPLLGEEVWSDGRTAVWRRSSRPIPAGFPRSGGGAERGILFQAWQAAGTHELPFALATHDLRRDDRDRSALYDFQVVDALAELSERLPPAVAGELLESARRHWATLPARRYEVGSWSGVVRELTARLARGPQAARRWRARHPNLAVVGRLPRGDVAAANRRREALAWRSVMGGVISPVQDGFLVLGYARLEELCERAGGFATTRAPTRGRERRRLTLLLNFVQRELADFFPPATLPAVRVIDSPASAWSGVAITHRLHPSRATPSGHRLRTRLEAVALRASALASERPFEALETLVHELAHMFGGDGSKRFGYALTELLGRIAASHVALGELERTWVAAS